MAGQTSHKKVLCGHVQDWLGRWYRVNDGSLEENGKQIEPHICAMAAKAKEKNTDQWQNVIGISLTFECVKSIGLLELLWFSIYTKKSMYTEYHSNWIQRTHRFKSIRVFLWKMFSYFVGICSYEKSLNLTMLFPNLIHIQNIKQFLLLSSYV